jgi:hypothetical protein
MLKIKKCFCFYFVSEQYTVGAHPKRNVPHNFTHTLKCTLIDMKWKLLLDPKSNSDQFKI